MVKPTSVEDGQVIIDTLLDNRTVVVNLEGITTDTAQRIMDITADNIRAFIAGQPVNVVNK